jgi:YD repeat-containing protein
VCEIGPEGSTLKPQRAKHNRGGGYKRQARGYLQKSLPPLAFEYSQAVIREDIREIDAESLENLPYGLDGSNYQWADLDGEGVSGILTEQADGWFYKPNLGGGHFGPLETVAVKPSLAALHSGHQQLLDLAGDGQLDLVAFDGSTSGFYERTHDQHWERFTAFASLPNLSWDEPNLRFVDLNGDGHADVLITENDALTWYPSLAEEGFGPAQHVRQPLDEESGPRLVFADGTQSVYLADMSGDGLTDLVRIRNGEVCYWPNLGYGRFGVRVTMDNAPWLDSPDQFDQRRLRLADIDGSGNSDIIYLGREGVRLYFNQSGNRWSEPHPLSQFPHSDNLSAVTAVDLLGNGTACLVWSSPLPGDTRRPMRYIDLMGGQKPHLLIAVKNNLGAETRVHYAPSTRFYLADKAAGTPWVTRLPFPVHVVERVETYDRISRNRFVTRYGYHHGYFDGIEREFRGFGMVEQWDTEEIGSVTSAEPPPEDVTNWDTASFVPPAYTKTWFHTGAFFAGAEISLHLAHEYYGAPHKHDPDYRTRLSAFLATLLPDTSLPSDLPAEEEREACRALKGSILRQEIYALDGSPHSQHPYSIAERDYTLKRLQSRADNRHAVFFAHAHESLDYHYERNPADPRVGHALTLEVDDFGNVLKSAAIGYGRAQPDLSLAPGDQAKQTQTHITYTENDVTNGIDEDDAYRTPLACETRTYELSGFEPPNNATHFSANDFAAQNFALIRSASDIPYEQTVAPNRKQKRLIEHMRTLYRRNNLVGALPLGEVQSLALPFESYKLAFTPGLVAEVYSGRVTDTMLQSEGRYVHSEGDANWWIPSGQVFYSPDSNDPFPQELTYARQHFFLSCRFRNPFGHTTAVAYDPYDLLVQETRDALGNRVTAGERNPSGTLVAPGNDYRVLQPKMVMDPNRNRSAVTFDALGMVVGTAVMGKPEENLGDSLATFRPDLTRAEIDQFFGDPKGAIAHTLLENATTRIVYDLDVFRSTQTAHSEAPDQWQPVYAATIVRETHVSDLPSGQQSTLQVSFSYSDGFGREVQKKIQAEPGPLVGDGPEVSPRWVGSGWTIFNNKGKPVRQYEPFFSPTHRFEFARLVGVSSVLFYDPVERVVSTLHPNHTYEKVVFDPWRQVTWDVNDTVLQADPKQDPDVGDFFRRLPDAEYLPTWHAQRQSGALGPQEQAASTRAAQHAETPAVASLDTLGRTFRTAVHNRFERNGTTVNEAYVTRVNLDIEGNQREVIDARDRIVMRYDYDMLGNRIHQASMEAGERWMLNDVAGKPIYARDSRGHTLRTTYDALRRPTGVVMREGTGPGLLVQRTVYGETQSTLEASNLRGKVYQAFDAAGVVTSDAYDFKGNLLRSSRRLAVDDKNTVDWSAGATLETQTYTSRTAYDALNRPTQLIAPHSDQPGATVNVIQPIYNEANLLERVHAWLNRNAEPGRLLDPATANLHAVTDIDYNAKGQRTLIEYGNGVKTEYEYDEKTFRLTRLTTTRGPNFSVAERTVQDLHYTYDPTGNITHIRDDAQQTIYFRNRRVEPNAEYTYDAVYRLIEATGREHLGQASDGSRLPPVPTSHTDAPRVALLHPGDGNAMGNYVQRYVYDEVGSILEMLHRGTDPAHPGWTRTYRYSEPSLLESGKTSNRLTSTQIGGDPPQPYTHDAHGNMTTMPHLPLMRWDYRDQFQATSQQAVSNGTPEITYYVYDASGQRVRKVTERQAAAGRTPTREAERIYLGGLEIYREYAGNGTTVNLERETLHIMDGRQYIALIETRTRGNDGSPMQLIRHQFSNHLGSTSLELDE